MPIDSERQQDIILADHATKLALLEQSCMRFHESQQVMGRDVKSILSAVNGNGKPGLKTEVELIKEGLKSLGRFFVMLLIIGIPAALGMFYFACTLPAP